MNKLTLAVACAAASLTFTATASAQDAEPARTTYRVMAIDLKPDADAGKYDEMITETLVPAYEAAGLVAPQVHWVMANDDWDYLMVDTMKDGMATFDSHMSPARAALRDALLAKLGSEEKVEEFWKQLSDMEAKTKVLFTHTHP